LNGALMLLMLMLLLLLLLPLGGRRFEFLAGDDVFLGAAAKVYAAEGSSWRRSYYLPTSADLAITKMRQWMVSQHCRSGAQAHDAGMLIIGPCHRSFRTVTCTEQRPPELRVPHTRTAAGKQVVPMRGVGCALSHVPGCRHATSPHHSLCSVFN
jgi:hypothetical protein